MAGQREPAGEFEDSGGRTRGPDVAVEGRLKSLSPSRTRLDGDAGRFVGHRVVSSPKRKPFRLRNSDITSVVRRHVHRLSDEPCAAAGHRVQPNGHNVVTFGHAHPSMAILV